MGPMPDPSYELISLFLIADGLPVLTDIKTQRRSHSKEQLDDVSLLFL